MPGHARAPGNAAARVDAVCQAGLNRAGEIVAEVVGVAGDPVCSSVWRDVAEAIVGWALE